MKIKFEVEVDTSRDEDKDILEELLILIQEIREYCDEKG
jgi:hypothetical protein